MKIRALVFVAAVAVLAGCGRQERVREIDWAKAALARNPAYEIVATDEAAGVFTVKDTTSGEVSAIRVDDLVAAPAPPRAAKPVRVAPAPEADTPDATSEEQPADTAPDPALAATQTTAAGEVVVTPAANGTSLAEGPGYSISRADPKAPVRPAATSGTFEGPGYRISRGEPLETPPASSSAPRAEAVVANANVLRRSDPIICQGERLMRIDGETLEFSGDALIAEEGCDLYISNARISAGGVGLIARQARVHIVNSTIHGTAASYEASEGAELYLSGSTFKGLGRRFDTAKTTDLGGNDFKSH